MPVIAPQGTVTLVFTDIEGSTVLWEYFGEGFMALLDQHNALFREAITELGGYEVQTMGDAFIIAFQEAAPAEHRKRRSAKDLEDGARMTRSRYVVARSGLALQGSRFVVRYSGPSWTVYSTASAGTARSIGSPLDR